MSDKIDTFSDELLCAALHYPERVKEALRDWPPEYIAALFEAAARGQFLGARGRP